MNFLGKSCDSRIKRCRLTLDQVFDAICCRNFNEQSRALASTYAELGLHQDALVMREKTLEFRRRVLLENHPHIGLTYFWLVVYFLSYLTISALGNAMDNLASTCTDLGRHQDALVMLEKALEFRRRILPENHPDIGAT